MTTVTGGPIFTSIAVGFNTSCGLVAGGAAYCWGDNAWGRLGIGEHEYVLAPTPVSGGVTFRASRAAIPTGTRPVRQ